MLMKLLCKQVMILDGACYGVAKCVKIILEKGKMVLQERMKTMDPDQQEIYKFKGVEQGDGLRVKEEVSRRLQCSQKLN